MSKYIKRVNWPFVEIEDNFEGINNIIINMNDVSAVWSRVNSRYHYGVRYKNGDWFEFLSQEALEELQDLIMNHQTTKNGIGSLYGIIDPELLNESQSLYEWLNDEGQI